MFFSKQYFIDKKDFELSHNFRRLFLRTCLLVIIFSGAVYFINYNEKRQISTGQWMVHTKDVISILEKTMSHVKDYETSSRGFVISGNEDFLEPAKKTKESLADDIGKLRSLAIDNHLQQSSIDSLGNFINRRIVISDSTIWLRRYKGLTPALELVSSGIGKRYMDTIRIIDQHIQEGENKLLARRIEDNKKAIFINRITLFACLAVFFISLVILFWQAWFNLKQYNDRQKEVNSILRQLAQSLMNAQKIAHLGSWEWNIKTNETKWSDEQFRIFGYGPQNTKATHSLFLNAIHPHDRKMVEATIDEAVKDKKTFNTYYRIIQPGGNIRHVHALGEIYTEEGKALIAAGTIQDITELVSKEKENRQMAEILNKTNKAARVGWWELNVRTGKRKWSAVTKEILEVSPDFEPEGDLNFLFIKDEATREKFKTTLSDAILHGTAYDEQLDIITAKGNTVHVRAIGQPEFEDGQCIKLYGIFQQLGLPKEYEAG